ncbi:MAG: ADP-ribosylglycohydrolase family protein [bacterium]
MDKKLLKKYQGSLLGLAIGDALGVPIEFKKVGEFEPINDYIDLPGWFNLPAGHWSDDTAMALCLANSLIEKKDFDPIDQINRYKKWLEEGYCSSTGKAVGVGQTILRRLLTYRNEDNPYVEISPRHSEGNGSLMRLAPIPLYFRDNPKEAIKNAELSSKITHGSQLCSDACKYYAGLIIGALDGVPKEELLSSLYCPIPDFWKENKLSEEIENVALGSFKHNHPPFIQGSGYVVKSMEASLWAFYNSDSFEEGVLKAINLGDDADTTGAIYGQLAGAYYGIDGIPKKWIDDLARNNEILNIASKLCKCG